MACWNIRPYQAGNFLFYQFFFVAVWREFLTHPKFSQNNVCCSDRPTCNVLLVLCHIHLIYAYTNCVIKSVVLKIPTLILTLKTPICRFLFWRQVAALTHMQCNHCYYDVSYLAVHIRMWLLFYFLQHLIWCFWQVRIFVTPCPLGTPLCVLQQV